MFWTDPEEFTTVSYFESIFCADSQLIHEGQGKRSKITLSVSLEPDLDLNDEHGSYSKGDQVNGAIRAARSKGGPETFGIWAQLGPDQRVNEGLVSALTLVLGHKVISSRVVEAPISASLRRSSPVERAPPSSAVEQNNRARIKKVVHARLVANGIHGPLVTERESKNEYAALFNQCCSGTKFALRKSMSSVKLEKETLGKVVDAHLALYLGALPV